MIDINDIKRDDLTYICVYGAANEEIDEDYKKKTEDFVCDLITESKKSGADGCGTPGYGMIYGAGGTGLMGAAARGAVRAGCAQILGIAPEFMSSYETLFDRDKMELILTQDMADRKTIMEEVADEFYVFPGGIGTYDELFQCVTQKQLDRHTKPIHIVNIDGFYDRLLEAIRYGVETGFISEHVWNKFDVIKL